MNRFGINVELKHTPALDPEFIPLMRFNRAFLATAKKPVGIAVERADGQMASCRTFIHGTPEMAEADHYYIERLVKTILWMKGGFKVYVSGDEGICEYLKSVYCAGGQQAFDWDYMANVFEHPFEIVLVDDIPAAKDDPKAIGGHMEGCRIGFDAGGSDRKVSAVIDGETVYSEEVVWFPKTNADPDYHYDGIVSALKSAAEHMPRVDAVGVSSAGVFINNRTMNASLFLKVPKEIYDEKVKDIYIRAVRDTFGDVPYCVINDGDVSALAGAMSLNDNSVLGIAMGTSEAVGYVDEEGRITGWLNELAFVPVDAQPDAMRDEWSGDIGCGVKYFSQDGVIKLAPRAGIELDESASPAEKLKVVQKLMAEDDPRAVKVYESIGVYLGHTLAYYYELYGCRHVLLLGRVMSGKGGDLILDTAKKVLAGEYPELEGKIVPELPDEKFRRVGQSMAAASLPEIKK
ncbi:ROK family protein [uncultured Oscillibacter sp.]|jgi:predicted NBD/HSP70 family sugar kinase|uniref:ROK family protein n=1 Tax=uncultured Oscillibacter sp. TaxID=876091 RepID=UPI002171749D|nr:ROK family protein [uncultured Oscillibacter sp.]MCI9554908.1 ROK family protein [Oscillibacter sp.]